MSIKAFRITEYLVEGLHIVFSEEKGPNCGDCGAPTYWAKVTIEDGEPFVRAVCKSPKCLSKF